MIEFKPTRPRTLNPSAEDCDNVKIALDDGYGWYCVCYFENLQKTDDFAQKTEQRRSAELQGIYYSQLDMRTRINLDDNLRKAKL